MNLYIFRSFLPPPFSPIVGVFFSGSPSTIIRRIGSVVVFAVNFITIRAYAHISKKCFETNLPSFTDCDTPVAVSFISRIIGIQTPSFHVCPDTIFPWQMLSVVCGEAMYSSVCPTRFVKQTTTTLSRSTFKRSSEYCFYGTAIALANPLNTTTSIRSLRYNNKAIESLVNKTTRRSFEASARRGMSSFQMSLCHDGNSSAVAKTRPEPMFVSLTFNNLVLNKQSTKPFTTVVRAHTVHFITVMP